MRPISFAIELCTKRFGKIATGVDEPVTQASANSVLIPVPVALPIPTSPRRFWCPAFTARADANAEEKSYFGADASQYDQRSAFPGILNIKTPLLLAWSTQDPPRLVAEGETLKQRLCNPTTHCPRTTVLGNRESLASVFEASASSGGLAPPTLELVRE